MVQDYQENYGRGWISLYRSIKDHWVWSDPVKLKWWLLVLFEVNHSDNKVAIGYKVVECKRGQSLKSLRTWASEFGCGTKAATRFFDMLESDGMITRETIGKGKHSTTLLTVCNYDTYQSKKESEETLDTTQGKHKGDTKETQGKRKRHTNNNDNNANNGNNENKQIPAYEDFKEYALDKCSELNFNVSENQINAKYQSWKTNGWRNGNGKQIKNWKSTLLNTLPYLNGKDKHETDFKNFDNVQYP